MRLRRLLTDRFANFLIILVVIYVIVWLQVFHTRSDNVDDEDEDVPDACNCPNAPQGHPQDTRDTDDSDDQGTPRYLQVPSKSYSPGHVKMVLVLAYQRVGSSFFGKIFDLNPDIFYVYEPLDSLYQSMYGTDSGHNVPSDITSHKNGSNRHLPRDEVEGVSQFLHNLMTCELDRLPTEFFVHSFWSFLAMFMPSWEPYLQCLNHTQLIRGRAKCHHPKCPKRFGVQPLRSDKCKEGHIAQKDPMFIRYKECMDDVRQRAERCTRMMDAKCKTGTFRAVKTVRATMKSVEELIVRNPNFRVIHLFRDPRAVAVSRLTTVTYRGIYSRNSSVLESQLYCSILRRDLALRHDLEVKYPGTFFEVIYEDFVHYPAEYAKAVYKFLDIAIPETMLPWLEERTRGKKIVTQQKAPRWKKVLTVEDAEAIVEGCKDLYDMIDYDFR